MNISPPWISVEIQEHIEPTPILLINKEPEEVNEYDIIKIKIFQNTSVAASETYEMKIVTFEHGQPE